MNEENEAEGAQKRARSPRCAVTYDGATFPALRGTRCERDAPHHRIRHYAKTNGKPLQWWTEAEKIALMGGGAA